MHAQQLVGSIKNVFSSGSSVLGMSARPTSVQVPVLASQRSPLRQEAALQGASPSNAPNQRRSSRRASACPSASKPNPHGSSLAPVAHVRVDGLGRQPGGHWQRSGRV